MLRRVRATLVGSVGPDGERSFAEVVRVLRAMRDELARHFADEEAGGCLDEAVSRCLKLSADVEQIKWEHPALLAELDRLLASAAALSPTAANQIALERDFDALLVKLRPHEKAENRILSEAFGSDLTGDENGQETLILDV